MTRDSADSDGDPVIPETTQNLADLLAFLRADALDVYDALDADERARVDRWRREYRQEMPTDSASQQDAEHLLKRVAVDKHRIGCATDVVVRHGLAGDDDHADTVRDVAMELARLTGERCAGLERLGVLPIDGGGPEGA